MKLLESFQRGSLMLKTRLVMAAMTRSRADIHGVVGPMGQMLVNEIRLRDLVLAFAHVGGQRCADVEPLWIRHEKRSVDGAAGITRLGEVLAEPPAGSAGVLPHRLVECGGEVVAVRNGESALDEGAANRWRSRPTAFRQCFDEVHSVPRFCCSGA